MEEASAKLARSTASQVAAALDELGRTALPGSPSDDGQISAAVDRLDARTEVTKAWKMSYYMDPGLHAQAVMMHQR